MLKQLAMNLLGGMARRLPWGGREAVFNALCDEMGNTQALMRIAARVGVVRVSARGQWGLIQSVPEDGSVLPEHAKTGDWAPPIRKRLAAFFGAGPGTYLDIGANIGLTTLPIAQNPAIRCFAFEPDPTNFENLVENLRRNAPHGNVTPLQLALLDRPGKVSFGLTGDTNIGNHHIVRAGSARQTIEVEGASLDSLELPITGRLAVKIDTEGAEPLILAGGTRTLGQAGLVIMEYNPTMIADLGGDPEVIFGFIAGFERVAIIPGDSDAEAEYRPAAEACAELRRLYAEKLGDRTAYFDIYATRGE